MEINTELEMLPSERKQYHDKIKQLIEERNTAYGCALRKTTSLINQAEWINTEMKIKLLDLIWSKE